MGWSAPFPGPVNVPFGPADTPGEVVELEEAGREVLGELLRDSCSDGCRWRIGVGALGITGVAICRCGDA